MFSRSIEAALEAINKYDDEPWAKFSFYPCPVGAPTPKGCLSNPCPPKEPGCYKPQFTECCVKDKFEDCLVSHLNCFDDTNCTFENRLKLSKFLGCFEGGHIEEDTCPQDPKNCTDFAGIDYEPIEACFKNESAVKAAGAPIDEACTKEDPAFWPHVKVNGEQAGGPGCDQDSCVIPILPVLCKAYAGSPKPKSCTMLDKIEY